MEGFDSEKSKWKFSNKDIYVESLDKEFLENPTKIRLKNIIERCKLLPCK